MRTLEDNSDADLFKLFFFSFQFDPDLNQVGKINKVANREY